MARTPVKTAAPVSDLDLFERVRKYVGFTHADSALLAGLFPHVAPHLTPVIEDFYRRIESDARARRAITGGREQIERLKKTQREWLVRLLKGPHDAAFAQAQLQIGRAHVRVGLEQAYMVTGIWVLRDHLDRILDDLNGRGTQSGLATRKACHKILDIVLALMLESYHHDYMRKVLQAEQNATVQRLAALGEVAASIAHEIRNPLAGINGAIQVFAQDMRKDDPRQEIVGEILREIRRLDERVNDLLLYARPANLIRELVRPRDLLQSTIRVLTEDPMFKTVRVRIRAAKSLPPFPLDSNQIQQVLLNLVLNAVQAMNGSGQVLLEAQPSNGGGLEIAVEDSGPGVPPEMVGEIFRPFFTTRRHGTGLGLPISRKIVESHGGTLEVRNGKRGGARFSILLPSPVDALPSHAALG